MTPHLQHFEAQVLQRASHPGGVVIALRVGGGLERRGENLHLLGPRLGLGEKAVAGLANRRDVGRNHPRGLD